MYSWCTCREGNVGITLHICECSLWALPLPCPCTLPRKRDKEVWAWERQGSQGTFTYVQCDAHMKARRCTEWGWKHLHCPSKLGSNIDWWQLSTLHTYSQMSACHSRELYTKLSSNDEDTAQKPTLGVIRTCKSYNMGPHIREMGYAAHKTYSWSIRTCKSHNMGTTYNRNGICGTQNLHYKYKNM